MSIRMILTCAAALIALDLAQAAFAESPNPVYYPGGVADTPSTAVVERVDVMNAARLANRSAHEPRTEFGFASHDTTQSVQTRAEVQAQALTVEQPSSRSYFSY